LGKSSVGLEVDGSHKGMAFLGLLSRAIYRRRRTQEKSASAEERKIKGDT
jgi:hypothetical protein